VCCSHPYTMILGLFDAIHTSGATMVPKLQQLLNKFFFFIFKIIAYVKNKGPICRCVQMF
jgi:hypothetical protein